MEIDTKPKVPWWQPHLALFWRLSGYITLPVLAAVMVGKWLDRKFQSAPWLFLLSVGAAFVFSMSALVVIGTREMRKIEKEDKKK